MYFTLSKCLHLLDWQVERDAPLDAVPVLEVAEEPDGDVEARDDHHGGVQHAVPPAEVLGVLHLVLEGQDDPDALESVDSRAEVQRKLAPFRKKKSKCVP